LKLLVIGLGQCGGRIADQFSRINNRARSQQKIEIVTGVFAVNTDVADLSGLKYIQSDFRHRILIGGKRTGGHGVGKINELAAELVKADTDKVSDAIRSAKNFYESDAFLLIASSGGGTGSGSLPVLAQYLKERYRDKPVFVLMILPFEHEETTEMRTIYNTALCLKSVHQVADAVILVDNQRYIKKDSSLSNNISRINELIAEPFYNLLCAGEEKKVKYIGAKLLDAGDIMQTLRGWTVIGYGRSELPTINIPFFRKSDFRSKSTEIHKGIQAMDEAMGELSLACDPADASKSLYLLSAPAREMNMDLIKDLGDYMRTICPKATIRNGDYPRGRGALDISIILSGLSNVEKVREYYKKGSLIIPEFERREEEVARNLNELENTAKGIMSLVR
jgi:cell division GTPase FtsZ